MSVTAVEDIEPNFKKRKKPTEGQIKQIFDSFGHKNRDFDLLGGGLKPFSPNRPYTQGEGAFILGRLKTANDNIPVGAYNPAKWTDFDSDPAVLGIAPWTPGELIEFDPDPTLAIQRTHKSIVWQAIDSSQGIEPGVDPDSVFRWKIVGFLSGGNVPIYVPDNNVEVGKVYEFRGMETEFAKHGGYRASANGEEGLRYFYSSDFSDEVENGFWEVVWLKNPTGGSGGPIDPEPTEDSTNAVSSGGVFTAFEEIRDGVPELANTLNKLYNIIVGQTKEITVSETAARDALDITELPTNVFVVDDGDGNWALYKATSTGVGATFVKLSDPDLLNAALTASQIKVSYESNPDTHALTDAFNSILENLAAGILNLGGTTGVDFSDGAGLALNAIKSIAGKNCTGVSSICYSDTSAPWVGSTGYSFNHGLGQGNIPNSNDGYELYSLRISVRTLTAASSGNVLIVVAWNDGTARTHTTSIAPADTFVSINLLIYKTSGYINLSTSASFLVGTTSYQLSYSLQRA